MDQKIGREFAAVYPMAPEVARAFAVRNLEYAKTLKNKAEE